MPALELPPNPGYGSGMFIRSLLLTTPEPRRIRLAMEDMGHAFQLEFEHDGHTLTRIDARWQRHPLSTCPGAPAALQAMVGCPLSDNIFDPQRFGAPRHHCTHLFDMLRMGIVHAWHRRPDRRYDVIIHDALAGPQHAECLIDGHCVMAIAVLDNVIRTPERLAGVNLMRGFGAWAGTHLAGEELEALFMLQRGFFIASGRRSDYGSTSGLPASLSGMPEGVCYASQPDRYAQARRLDTMIDYSDHPEDMLRFFPLS